MGKKSIFVLALLVLFGHSSRITGQNREMVRHVQELLKDLKYDIGAADGVLGSKTERALKQFQMDNALPATGKLDDTTKEVLQERHKSASANASRTGGTRTVSGPKGAEKAAEIDERDWSEAVSSDTREAYLKYFRAHQDTTRLGIERGPVKFRVTPHSSRAGRTIRYNTGNEPQIQVETKEWVFTLSIADAREAGLIADDLAKDAVPAFAGASSVGGTDYATGRFLLYYVDKTIDTAIAVWRKVPDPSSSGGTRTNLLAVLNGDLSPILVTLEELKSRIRR